MNKTLRFVSSLIAVTLVVSSFAGVHTRADAQNIQVTPYPAVAGAQASYQIKFNVNTQLQAGRDSLSVIFPKESNLDSTISSGNICVNPRELVGADFEADYRTGTVRLMNPLRKGDRVVADYRYQPGPDYTQLPRNVKFYDLTFATPDVRSGNGKLDAGEWIYEDRDNNSRISIGDRRLSIVFAGGTTYRQGSLLQVGDGDFGLTAESTRPITSFSATNLTFVDNNGDGIYNENDWLVDDRNQNFYLDRSDVLVTGIFDYQSKSITQGSEFDLITAGVPTVVNQLSNDPPAGGDYVYTDNVIANSKYDNGEYIYEKQAATPTKEVQAGDIRWSWVISGTNVFALQSVVIAGDNDIGSVVKCFPWAAASSSTGYTNNTGVNAFDGWNIYTMSRNAPSTVTAGNTRETNIRFGQYMISAAVAFTDADISTPLFAFAANEKFFDSDGDKNPWITDPIYRDLDNNSSVSEGDIRLNGFTVWDGSNKIHYTPGSIVRACEVDNGLALSTFTAAVGNYLHTENGIPNNIYDPGELTFQDVDATRSITNGDIRFNYYGVMSANVSIMNNNYSDYGLTLTKGWTDISGEVLVNYADGGEQILKLGHYPVIAPVIPQDNDVNYRVIPVKLNSNPTNFKNSGKWYYIVTAVSDDLNQESPPWEERMVDFTTGNNNAVELKWSPVPNASKYKVYRTKDAGTYGDDALVAVVKAPFTSYIDIGCDPLTGTPNTEYRSSFTQLYIERTEPSTGAYVSRLMNEYELSDYKIDCKSGTITFRKSLKQLDTVVGDYNVSKNIKNEKVVIDTISGRGQLRHGEVIDPDVYGEDEYKIELRKVSASNPNYPTVLVRGVDFQFMDTTNSMVEGLKEGNIVFYTQISNSDTVYADYYYREKVRGDLVAVANGNETQLRTHQNNIVPGTYIIYKGKTLSSAPVINVMNSERGPVVTFTTPVNVVPKPEYKLNPTPESKRDVTIVFSLQTGIRNPTKSGNYQLFVRTSQEQTEILSTPYYIDAGDATQQLLKLTQDQSVSAGQTIALTTTVQDDLGNSIPNVNIMYNIVQSPNNEGKLSKENFITDASGNAVSMFTSAKTPGLNTVTAHIVGTQQMVTFKITGLSTQPINRIEVSPKDARVVPNGNQLFIASGYSSSNEVVPNVKFNWSVSPTNLGIIDANGNFIASSTTGSGIISAEAYGVRGSAVVTVAAGQAKVSKIIITPSDAEVGVGETLQFIAKAYDDKGNELPLPFAWTVNNSDYASIDSNGLFTAKRANTSVIVIATEPGGMNQYATVKITYKESAISYIEVQPTVYQMNVGQTKQFEVYAYDKDGTKLSVNNVIWTIFGNIGLITNTGVFTASNVGIGQIQAQVGTLTATSVVTVNSSSSEDTNGPEISIDSPKDGSSVSENFIVVKGKASDQSGVKQVVVNNIPASLNADGSFTSQPISISAGSNVISIIATDNLNNTSMKSITVMKTVPVVIKLQIGNRNAVIIKNNMPQFVTIDLAPFTVDGRTVVPLRFITESFGALIDWQPDVPATGEGQIKITLDKSNGDREQLIMHTGSTFMKKVTTKNGVTTEQAINYSPAPYIVKPQNRTVVPLRFISEQFGAKVDWNAPTQEITITYYP